MELEELRNLGPTSAEQLRSIGVTSAEDLDRLGSVTVFRMLKERFDGISRVYLYALEGALLDVLWTDLPPGVKDGLLSELAERDTG